VVSLASLPGAAETFVNLVGDWLVIGL